MTNIKIGTIIINSNDYTYLNRNIKERKKRKRFLTHCSSIALASIENHIMFIKGLSAGGFWK